MAVIFSVDYNGSYIITEETRGGKNVYRKDDTHWLRYVEEPANRWILTNSINGIIGSYNGGSSLPCVWGVAQGDPPPPEMSCIYDDWDVIDEVTTDQHSHYDAGWYSEPYDYGVIDETADSPIWYDYAVGAKNVGRLYRRQYLPEPADIPPSTYYYIDVFGRHFRSHYNPPNIQTQTALGELPWVDWQDTLEVDDFTGDLCCFKSGNRLYYSWTGDEGRHLAYSTDDGMTATEVADALMDIDWTMIRSWQFGGIEYMLGYDSGDWKVAARDIVTNMRITFADGSQEVTITTGENRAAGFHGTANGWLYADIPKSSGMIRYRSKDSGSTWESIDD